jgi:uracil phosphoribosyltransferase
MISCPPILLTDGFSFWIPCLPRVSFDSELLRVTATTLTSVSGGSATLAVEVLKQKGVPEHRILFLNLIASPSGVAEFAERFPKLRVVTAFIDQGLDDKKYSILLFSAVDETY